jgi:uncharacterized protein (DUF58 family)
MTRSPKLALYASFAAASFVAALALGRPELAALGAPFAFILVIGLSLAGPSQVDVRLRLDRERAVEGDEVEAELELVSPVAGDVRLALLLPDGIGFKDATAPGSLRLEAGRTRTLPLRLTCERWGAYRLGDAVVRSRDRLGLRVLDSRVRGDAVLRVYPLPERLQTLINPVETQPFAGSRVARVKGEGIEFADVRPFVAGDRARRINWRASALRQTLYVDEQHPERNSDVVVFLDSFTEVRATAGGTLDLAVRAADSLVEAYLAEHDRVGLVGFGGLVRWLTPASGLTQRYRIVEALLETEVFFSYAWKNIDVLPRRTLPPQALVIALTPLLDERSVNALLDVRSRGFDLVVVDVSPLPFAEAARERRAQLAFRLWRLWREALRFRYERLGAAVVEWDGRAPLAAAVEEVRAFRRFARYASA